MKIEGYTPEDLHNVQTLKNVIRARGVYEESRLEKNKPKVAITRGKDARIEADATVYTIWTGVEAGVRQQLYSAGHHVLVHEIYSQERAKDSGK